ncbi:hypothetical protein D477_002024 [Arthrobacter crystallopoietes BAB-32]|uniref:Acetone carboxylase n=1 Tax=Arthrobacter crystallopoietes BAB-32 TaxID=1246476 RepID=N1V3L3_9MICC|nr:hypothetical protein [Arthrobacter crystallopoietes]EMY35940.1 hypothetical protein D477_002024 [Arthrobacter crystallopoietes BAB-32]
MSIFDQLSGGGQPVAAATTCSRKGCRSAAQWQLLWNNPKIHTPERRKVWLACDEHRDWLQDYLEQRGLWRETTPFDAAEPTAGGR